MTAEAMRAWRDRKRAEGYVFRRGVPVWQPEGPRWPCGSRPHGTTGRYRQGCRCDRCRAANAAYARQRRRLRRDDGEL